MTTSLDRGTRLSRFRQAYAEHRAIEGRATDAAGQLALPYLRRGPRAREWAVRARSFDALMRRVVRPLAREAARPLRIVDLGAGNGWLGHRLTREGHEAVALEWRRDRVDGLGASRTFRAVGGGRFFSVAGSFDAMPLADRSVDAAVFNAAVHYAEDLARVLGEAARVVRPEGRVVIVDSPFYARAEDGERMVAEKRAAAGQVFGERAADLLALRPIEYLTPERLARAAALPWRRHRVRYPLWYELRPVVARLAGRRPPSRFDVWEARVP